MASYVYNAALVSIVDGSVDLVNDSFKCALVDDYTYSASHTAY